MQLYIPPAVWREGSVQRRKGSQGGSLQTQLSIHCLGIVGKEHGTREVAIKYELRGETMCVSRFKALHQTTATYQ